MGEGVRDTSEQQAFDAMKLNFEHDPYLVGFLMGAFPAQSKQHAREIANFLFDDEAEA